MRVVTVPNNWKVVNAPEDCRRSGKEFLKSFSPILLLFYIKGVDISSYPRRESNKSKKHMHFNIFIQIGNMFVLVFPAVCQLLWVLILPMKKIEGPLLLVFLIQISYYYLIRRSQNQIGQILKILNRISHQLQCDTDYRKRKTAIYVFCIVMYSLCVAYLYIYFCSERRIIDQEYLKNYTLSRGFSKLSSNCLPPLRDFAVSFYTLGSSILIIGTTACYTFLCVQMRCLFLHIANQIQSVKEEESACQLLHAYGELANVLSNIDDIFSYTVFVLVVSSMAGLFRPIYSLIFLLETHFEFSILYLFSGIYFSIVLLSVIFSASEAVQAGRLARGLIVSLPGFLPFRYTELKKMVRRNFKREIVLTLWKTYTIDRSLLFSALGTLATYGILIATLGNVQS
ncbi:hypothetical protein AVEN_178990-1 [Araneus ventricosus]|uniref:Gustatory receptor n=1 Tax=Araneus ventricosus TaxID=182803 RepID=A0A4Y2T9R7_ARAVE|nr:hypothetical protein AVEN_178990-1 [Araneus ventricosus]